MKLFSCLNPKVIRNKYTKELVVARCGKCSSCLNARAANWVQRLDEEYRQHRFCVFATFQYNEQNVYQFVRLRRHDWHCSIPAYIDGDTGQIIQLSDCPDVTQADVNYCFRTKVLLVPHYKDFQLFIKRLRKDLKLHYNDAKFRYYCNFEIGPTTYRPHAHSLFFFDSTLLAQTFTELLSKHWQYGNVFDPHFVNGSTSRYVASYINCSSVLPKIYLHPKIRPKSLFSKCPPIGSFDQGPKMLQQLFDSCQFTFPLFIAGISKFRDVPLWRSLQNRLYPRIKCFDSLSRYDRILLYQLSTKRFVLERNYEQLIDYLKQPYWQNYLQQFVMPNRFGVYVLNIDSLKRFVSSIVRVRQNAEMFNVSISEYVIRLSDYYENLKFYELTLYYQCQDDYFREHPVSEFLSLNVNFVVAVRGKMYSDLTVGQRFYLDLYLPDYPKDKPINISYSDKTFYRELYYLHTKIAFDNTKVKKSNDYLMAHRDKFNNIISYNQEIQNYVKSEII